VYERFIIWRSLNWSFNRLRLIRLKSRKYLLIKKWKLKLINKVCFYLTTDLSSDPCSLLSDILKRLYLITNYEWKKINSSKYGDQTLFTFSLEFTKLTKFTGLGRSAKSALIGLNKGGIGFEHNLIGSIHH